MVLVEYIAGIAGGVAVVLVGHPFDTTKILMVTSPQGFYSSTIDCVKKTLKWNGLRGFYSGISSPLLGQMFFRAASFASFSYSTNMLEQRRRQHMPHSSSQISAESLICAGAITGFVISFIETPIDLVKTKLQIQVMTSKIDAVRKPAYDSVFGCVKHITQRHGMIALWQGWVATSIRNVPANALFFPVNELVKRRFAEQQGIDTKDLSLYYKASAGAIAGLSYWVLTFPLDVIKGQSQAFDYSNRIGWLKTIKYVYNKGGLMQFTYGIVPCAVRAIPACAAMFTTVDLVRNYLQ